MDRTEGLEEKIGYTFKDRELLKEALTHSSCQTGSSYERLEFLGDSVLEMIVRKKLFELFPEDDEGKLTHMRIRLVGEEYLSGWAKKISLGDHILFGYGEIMNGGREKGSILADVVESLTAAIYLDGGMEAAEKFVNSVISNKNGIDIPADYKSELQELIQKNGKPHTISYQESGREGPPHNQVFTIDLMIDGELMGTGKGSSKKNAEKEAAKTALEKLKKSAQYDD